MEQQDLDTECPEERLRTLEQLEVWLAAPMQWLSLVWLAIVVAELVRGTGAVLTAIGTAIWILFIVEFLVRLRLAPDRRQFLRRNWLTLVSLVVPALRLVRALAILRAGRLLRGLRLVRIVGTANRSMNALRATLRRRQFGYVLGITALVIGLGAAGMFSFEPATQVEGGFTSYGDALWWTAMLVSSVGSEFWPRTTEGRALTSLLTLYGLAVFGYVTASLASFFIDRDAQRDDAELASARELRALRAEVDALRRDLAERRIG